MLTYPLALLALAALPALAAIYILRNRFRRRQVSSLMLWQFRVQSKEGGARVHRLQLPLLFFLELLVLALLVIAAAGPHWKLPQTTRPLIVVLDDSFSMRAISGDASAQARAREALQKIYRFQPPPSTRLVLAGIQPRVLGGPVKEWPEVEALLAQWTCRAPAAALDTALTLASEIGKQQANILVLTDHEPPDKNLANNRLQWRSFGRPAENVAIVNASRTVHGDEDRCLIEVANFSARAKTTVLQVQTGSNAVQRAALSLAPGEQQRLVFNIPGRTPALEAALENDVLLEDNRVQLLPPVRQRVRVRVSLADAALAELAERTLNATGLRAAISEQPQLVIHDSDISPANDAWSLRWLAPEQPLAYTGPFMVDNAHPLAEGITLNGVVWAAADLTNSSGEVPVVLAGNVPLLSAREDILGRQFLTLNLAPELSTLQATPDWPVLFWNLLQWRAAQLPGLRESNARLGAEVLLQTAGEPVTVIGPDQTVKTFPGTGGPIVLETPLPGIYSVITGAATNALAVNSLAADESNLAARTTGQWGDWSVEWEKRHEQSPMAWLFALMALGLMTAHLYLLASGRGGS